MNKLISFYALTALTLSSSSAWAEDPLAPLPDLPPLPVIGEETTPEAPPQAAFDEPLALPDEMPALADEPPALADEPPALPDDPLADLAMPPIEPIEPLDVPQMPQTTTDTTPPPAVPNLSDEADFGFFQPGAQLPPLPDESSLPPLTDIPATLDIKPAPSQSPQQLDQFAHKRPLNRSFNYKREILSPRVYKQEYDAQNRHLPARQTQHSYDQATFAAAASNNLDGLRAMLEYGGRARDMRNEHGESLADVAYRFRAYDTLHYLSAIGVRRGQQHSSFGQNSENYAMRAAR